MLRFLRLRAVHVRKMFRGKYLAGLEYLLEEEALHLPPQLADLANREGRRRWLRRCRKKSWVVYSKAPFAGPRKLVDYLGRYTHRTAISNHRLVHCEEGQVAFRYRDRSDGDRVKVETLPADEFLARFLQHILPDNFARVRHYGLLANCVKGKALAACRRLLGCRGPSAVERAPQTTAQWMLHLLGTDISRCPSCGGPLQRTAVPAVRPPEDLTYVPPPYPEFEAWDTS